MTLTYTPPINRQALGICFVLWVLSYVAPVYFLPITLFVHLWLATLAWGLALSGAETRGRPLRWVVVVPMAAVGLLAVCAFMGDDLVAALLLLAAAGSFLFGAMSDEPRWRHALHAALVAAGALSVGVALVQLLTPGLDIVGIAPSPTLGRAAANLRQPNHLAQLLLQGLVALIALAWTRGARVTWPSLVLAALLGAGLSFSQSRTGWLGLGLLLVWALFDKTMPRDLKRLPGFALLGCLLGLGFVLFNASLGGVASYTEVRAGSADVSASRFGIWANTLELIAQHPWFGVGWGQFGQAWSLTVFPSRPTAAFDHAHNLPLHLMAELGVPLAVALMGCLAWSVSRALPAARIHHPQAPLARCLLAALLMLGVHSLLEYPLWFSYFLLPAAFFLGQLVQLAPGADSPPSGGTARTAGWMLKTCGVLIVLGSLYAAWDYARVLQSFKPFGPGLRKSLEQRITEGRQSQLFGHWVDYGVVTNANRLENLSESVERAFQHRVNPHMLMIYAQHLHARGESDKASFVAARVREFRNPVSKEFFAICERQPPPEPLPFQCRAPERSYRWNDFK